MTVGPLALAIEFAALLEQLGLEYALGGSVASSFLGEPRTTIDVDFAVRLDAGDLGKIVDALHAEFYIPIESANRALAEFSSFNLISQATGLKIDVFAVGSELLDRRQIERRVRMVVRRSPRAEMWVTSAEDQVLRKLSWDRDGGEVSDRQWRDIVALIRTQRNHLDFADLEQAADQLQIRPLLERARVDATG
jgi:hypothetical protein